mmetsp:Transcript_15596/g.30618  ORF Transcript_15596/g.30618 Transcript_15596/m.30618 type:complete len:168 (+) Transcript_15596:215-718(+)
MQSLAWGTTFHDTMMFLALDLGEQPSPEKLQKTTSLILQLALSVPCPKCRHHAAEYFQTHPLKPTSTDDVVDQLVAFHNHLNVQLEKNGSWTTDQALKAFWERHYGIGLFLSDLDLKRLEDQKKTVHLQAQLTNALSKLKSVASIETGSYTKVERDHKEPHGPSEKT